MAAFSIKINCKKCKIQPCTCNEVLAAGDWQRFDMQTAQGKAAQGPVASEIAAMFTFSVLPTLRQHYYDPAANGKLGSWQEYQHTCARFAEELGIPLQERHRITLPFALSIDWDPRHTWLREVMASAGRCDCLREACEEEALREHNQTILDEIRELEEELLASAPATGQNLGEMSQRGAMQARRTTENELQAKKDELHQLLREKREKMKQDLFLHAYFVKSRKDCRFITVTLEQFMPLSKVSPDLHSPIEHLVKTIKECVKSDFQDPRNSDEELRQGRTYQDFINNAVAMWGNSDSGKRHIKGSVVKQLIICRILAASKGKRFRVLDHKKYREVVGTGGNWIENTRYT